MESYSRFEYEHGHNYEDEEDCYDAFQKSTRAARSNGTSTRDDDGWSGFQEPTHEPDGGLALDREHEDALEADRESTLGREQERRQAELERSPEFIEKKRAEAEERFNQRNDEHRKLTAKADQQGHFSAETRRRDETRHKGRWTKGHSGNPRGRPKYTAQQRVEAANRHLKRWEETGTFPKGKFRRKVSTQGKEYYPHLTNAGKGRPKGARNKTQAQKEAPFFRACLRIGGLPKDHLDEELQRDHEYELYRRTLSTKARQKLEASISRNDHRRELRFIKKLERALADEEGTREAIEAGTITEEDVERARRRVERDHENYPRRFYKPPRRKHRKKTDGRDPFVRRRRQRERERLEHDLKEAERVLFQEAEHT